MNTPKSIPPRGTPNEELRCALTGRPLKPEEAYWAPPLITTGALLSTILMTALRAPGTLGQVLSADLPDVPYAPEAKELLARRRSTEQAKFLGLVLVVLLALVGLVLILT